MKAILRNRLPVWFKQDIPDDKTLDFMRLFSKSGVNTVCQEAKCPNATSCFRDNEVTFMILGNTCTRNCRFCNVDKAGQPHSQEDEPYRISEIVKKLRLDYVVITSVSRDDLSDGGAGAFAKSIELIHQINRGIKVEVLIPDFQGKASSLQRVLDALPCVVAHNIETVERLYADLRPKANYKVSLELLRKIKEIKPDVFTKSSIMLGLGETKEEVTEAMRNLRNNNCDCLTLGQYLAPTINHFPVKEFITLERFKEYKNIALSLGFRLVFSGPKVRSSYKAKSMQKELSPCTI